jgi:hypothetical protein
MKPRPLFAALLLSAAVSLPAQPGPAAPAAPAGPKSAAPAAPAKTDAKKADAKKTAPKEEARVEGLVISRADGTFLGLTLQDGKFKLSFHDKAKKRKKADVARAVARWPNVHGPGQNRTVLNPAGDGTFLLGAQFVRPPLSFRLILTLIPGGEGEEGETYTVDFRG